MGACDHIGLFTNNAKRLENFYVEKLGFRREKEELLPQSLARPIFSVSSDCVFIRLMSGSAVKGSSGPVKLEIFQPVSSRLRREYGGAIGLNHWGYSVGDRVKFCEGLKKKKVELIEIKRNSHTVYFVKDPDQNLIEIRD